jgi:hypothetical protein
MIDKEGSTLLVRAVIPPTSLWAQDYVTLAVTIDGDFQRTLRPWIIPFFRTRWRFQVSGGTHTIVVAQNEIHPAVQRQASPSMLVNVEVGDTIEIHCLPHDTKRRLLTRKHPLSRLELTRRGALKGDDRA